MNRQALKLLLVSQDRDTLRGMSRFLQRFGYHVQACADLARAMALLQGNRPDLLLVDWDARDPRCRELCQAAGGDRRREYVFTLLMVDEPEPAELIEAIQTGVDDFLSRPAAYGEWLARLRAGARVLEYERRVRQQAGWDALTGLLSRTAFLARLQEEANGTGPLACVLFETDAWEGTRFLHGHAAGDRLLEGVAGSLEKLGGPYEALARLHAGQFAALLPGTDEAAALEWAEQVCGSIRETEFGGEPELPNLGTTLTAGVAAMVDERCDAKDLLAWAEEALDLANRSGGDCVVGHSQCAGEDERWHRLAEPGKLFEGTLARHVMTPSTVTLRPEHTMSKAVMLFRQTALSAIPVVDVDDRLQGLVMHPAVSPSSKEGPHGSVADAMDSDVTRLAEDATFAALMDHFLTASDAAVVIVDGDLPTGLVTRQSLLALIHPLTAESFAPRSPFVPTSDYLLVGDLCPAHA